CRRSAVARAVGLASEHSRRPGMVQAWIAGVQAQWTQALLRDGRRREGDEHLALAEHEYRAAMALGFEPGPLQGELGVLYSIGGRPSEAVRAFEAAEKAGLPRRRVGAAVRAGLR